MRSALDYIVAGLVVASGAALKIRHQFPIIDDPATYRRDVATVQRGRRRGPLEGVTVGLSVIEKWQPYHYEGSGRDHPLAALARLSNTDKHRALIQMVPVPQFPPDGGPNLTITTPGHVERER